MRKTLTTAVALVALGTIAAAFAAVAAGGTHSARGTHSAAQRVRIEVKGTDPFSFELNPTSRGGVLEGLIQPDSGSATFCCWRTSSVTRAGAKLDVSNPLLTLVGGTRGQQRLKIREQIEWVDLPDGWQVCTGTWKVVGGTWDYAGLSGHGRVACAWAPSTDPDRALRIRLFGFL